MGKKGLREIKEMMQGSDIVILSFLFLDGLFTQNLGKNGDTMLFPSLNLKTKAQNPAQDR